MRPNSEIKHKAQAILTCSLFVMMNLLSDNAAAIPVNLAVNPFVANIGYWYFDEDIRGVLKNRLGDTVYIAPAVPNVPELIKDIAKAALMEVRDNKPALIPVNLNNNHWTALAVRKSANGDFVVFFNDSLGGSVQGSSASAQYVAAIQELEPNAQIIDLQVHQQNDGSSCGAFTAENLIALAGLANTELTAADAKAVLEKIKDARAIRILHLNSLGGLYEKIVTKEEIASSQNVLENVEVINALALGGISNLATLTTDRLGRLYLADNASGFASGDDEANYGVWVKASFGSGTYKASKDRDIIKSAAKGVIIGADYKIDEDITVGMAVSSNQNLLKPKVVAAAGRNSFDSSFNSHVETITASLYGSSAMGDSLVFSGNIQMGKILAKTGYHSLVTGKQGIKLKGESLGANLDAHYYASLGSTIESMIGSIILVPSFGVSYETIKFKSVRQTNFIIGKTSIKKISISPSIAVTQVFEIKNISVIPELSAGYEHVVSDRSRRVNIKNNNGVMLMSREISVAKNAVNFGGSLTFAGDIAEFGCGYERRIEPKYLGHTIYVKLRVNI